MKILLTFILSILSVSTFAGNTSFFNKTPINSFTDQDTAIFSQAINRALSSTPNGQKYNWKNPNTSAMGYVQPLNNVSKQGYKCRNVKIFNKALGETDASQHTFCKVNGVWRLLE